MDSATLRDGFTLLMLALREDFGVDHGPWPQADLTASSCIGEDTRGKAWIEARQDGVVCGLPLLDATFREVAGTLPLEIEICCSDGDTVSAGQVLVRIEGSLQSILGAERTALNFLQRLSGIATQTRQLVTLLDGRAKLLDTRKTTPGWRRLEKYAVLCGGGDNHRMGLHDMVLIKENHIRGAGSIQAAVERARKHCADMPNAIKVEVEVTNRIELDQALEAGADVVMLDNFSRAEASDAAAYAKGRVTLELSGNVRLDNLESAARTGVDWISTGALTHSVTAFDCSLLVEETA